MTGNDYDIEVTLEYGNTESAEQFLAREDGLRVENPLNNGTENRGVGSGKLLICPECASSLATVFHNQQLSRYFLQATKLIQHTFLQLSGLQYYFCTSMTTRVPLRMLLARYGEISCLHQAP